MPLKEILTVHGYDHMIEVETTRFYSSKYGLMIDKIAVPLNGDPVTIKTEWLELYDDEFTQLSIGDGRYVMS